MAEMTVPLVDRGNGLWGSPSPAWDHLINRESSGRPYVIQEIRDVNSGGNEAEGLFQITPKTWDRHGGRDFAPSARHATPQQQAIVAARIFTRNPTGSDWGAGRPGREDPRELAAGLVPVGGTTPPPPAPPAQTYGMPTGSNSGGYGGKGVRFPDWVYQLGDAFGIKPSTYPGHQESDRAEAGYARNPQRLNRGIDWAAPGAPDELDRLTRFADYLATIPQHLEQVIWQNPRTMRSIEVAGGRHQPGYFRDDLAGHRDHVHTRQSKSIPLPGNAPPPRPIPPAVAAPKFEQRDMFGKGGSPRSRAPINFFLHTEEGNGTAKSLAEYCQGQNGVSYHFTLRDRIVYYVVPTNLYSWSVLEANVFSVNLCFAGSRASFTRDQWLQREGDIDVAAFIAVREARHFGFSTEVLAPQPGRTGRDVYAGEARPGISDHNYVTRELGIGDHTDVGPNFPWDVFTRYVTKYANPAQTPGDDMALVPQDQWDRVYRELTQRLPSRSPLRHLGEGLVDTMAGFTLNADGHGHVQLVKLLASLGHPESLALLREVAAADPVRFPDRQEDAKVAQAILSELTAPKAKTVTVAAATPDPAPTSTPARATRELADAYAELARAREENARLREDNARLQTENVHLQSRPVEPQIAILDVTNGTTGAAAGRVVDAQEGWTEHVLAMDVAKQAALSKSLQSLQLPNGAQP